MTLAIFREFNSNKRDRSAEDRRRHRELVEDAIKRNISDIVAEESIIGVSKNKKVKIPVKGIKEYQFIYGKNKNGVGTGDGSEKRGDKVGEDAQKGIGQGNEGPGNQAGEDIYETEVTMEEIINYLFEDLELPDLDRRKLSEIESKSAYRKSGYQKKGIPPRLAKKKSMMERIKRKQGVKRRGDEELAQQRFPFAEDDLRYKRVREDNKKDFNAAVICIMDVSGSMDQTKKYMARSFYFLLYQFLRLRYENIEIAFIAHTTEAKEVTEKEFFHKGESGGTYISSGYQKALEIIESRYNPASWNVYAFHCSDGDNWSEDNKKTIELANNLCEVCNLFGYGEIGNSYYPISSTIKNELINNVKRKNFSVVVIEKKEDLLPGLKKLLDKEGGSKYE